MRNLKMIIGYDGTDFSGWQVQPGFRTVQEVLETAIEEIDPVKVEFELMELIPEPLWTIFSHRMITHGRRICDARKPNCEGCGFAEYCPKHSVKKKG